MLRLFFEVQCFYGLIEVDQGEPTRFFLKTPGWGEPMGNQKPVTLIL